jgi:hypothetical protein
MTRPGIGALLVSFTPFFATHRAEITDLAAKSRLPAIDGLREFAEQGGFMSYGVSRADIWR